MDTGDTAWVLISAALVLFMTPGLALFYGGMTGAKSVLNMLLMNFWCLLIVPPLWLAVGYSLAQGGSAGGWIGNFDMAFLKGIDVTSSGGADTIAIATFFGMFAIITPALISGAVAERMKFAAWAVFAPVWLLLVFVPVFKWVYGGWLHSRGVIDFAGGTAIHVNAGIAALALVLVLGKRQGWPERETLPHNLPLVMLGTGILWFGWFGFNAGSAAAANGQAVQAVLNTLVAGSAAALGWCIVEKVRDGRVTNLGVASGIVAGLVAITPCAGYVAGASPLFIGAIAGVACCFAIGLKTRFGFDDALDVVGVHLVGGLVGSILLGVFAAPDFFGGGFRAGLLEGGGFGLIGEQILANGVTMAFSFVVTAGIALALKATIGLRADAAVEARGLDGCRTGESLADLESILGSPALAEAGTAM